MDLKEKVSKLSGLFNFIKLTVKDLPIVVLYVVLYIILAVIPSLQIIAVADFIDKSIGIYNGTVTYKSIYAAIIMVAACLGGSFLVKELISFIELQLYCRYNTKISNKILWKKSSLRYSLTENEQVWDLITVIEKDPARNIMDGLNSSLNIISYIIKIAGIITVISLHIWWIGFAVLVISVPMIYISYRGGRVEYEAFEEAEKLERKTGYLQEILSSRDYADERKLFQYFNEICNRWHRVYEEMRLTNYKAFKKYFVGVGLSNSLTKILVVIIGIILLLPLRQGNITAGLYMSLLAGTIGLIDNLTTELYQLSKSYIKSILFYNSFQKFMDLEEEKKKEKKNSFKQNLTFNEIVFKNVSFTYPDSEKRVLDNLNLELKKGTKYALVGENGSGKTTIVKLLLGLYDTYEGQILIDGTELRNIDSLRLRTLYQVVFQDFYRYEVSIRDFLAMGFSEDEKDNVELDMLLKYALVQVGLYDKVSSLNNGVETKLGKLDDEGIDLSGGQWQRLAIARTIIQNRDFTILDEPTAAIDPVSESKLYELFSKATNQKSSLIITHRLGAAKIADEILVLKAGRIAERGTHEELIGKGGIYGNMFNIQRSWYHEN